MEDRGRVSRLFGSAEGVLPLPYRPYYYRAFLGRLNNVNYQGVHAFQRQEAETGELQGPVVGGQSGRSGDLHL